jgi:hypothetical protein
MLRAIRLTAVIGAVAALVPAGTALAQSGSSSRPGVPAGQIEFTQRTVQVTGSNAVPRFERIHQYVTTHTSHVTMTNLNTDKLRFEGVTSPKRELRYDATTNELTIAKGSRTPPYVTLAREARIFAREVADGCWTAGGDIVFEGRSATLYKLVPATSGPCRGDAQVGQAVVDKATGVILEREAGEADGSFKQVEALERFATLPLNRQTKKLLAWHDHPGAKRVVERRKTATRGRR